MMNAKRTHTYRRKNVVGLASLSTACLIQSVILLVTYAHATKHGATGTSSDEEPQRHIRHKIVDPGG